MNTRNCIFLLLFALTGTCLAVAAGASTGSVTGSVSVVCPFSITINALPTYAWGTNALFNYSVVATEPCTVPNMAGHFGLYYSSNDVLAYTSNVNSGAVSTTPVTGNVLFDTTNVVPGSYTATVNFSAYGENVVENQGVTFSSPANISITAAAVSSPISVGSPLMFSVNFTNSGMLASNAFVLYVNISGPVTSDLTYNVPGLSPGQNTMVTGSITGVTSPSGTYDFVAYGRYSVLGNTVTTNIVNLTYVVTASSGAGSTGIPSNVTQITPVPSINIVSIPVYTSLPAGTSTVSLLVLKSTGNIPEYVNFSIPASFKSIVGLSTGSLYLLPGQISTLQISFSSPADKGAATYNLPLSLQVSGDNQTIANQTEYLVYYVYARSPSQPSIINQVSLLDNATVAQGSIEVAAPNATAIKNATLQTRIPLAIAESKADLNAYGISNNVTVNGSYYQIDWHIASIPGDGDILGYYQINNPNPALVGQKIDNILIQQTKPSATSLLEIVNIALPQFYTNSSNPLGIYTLYTGTVPQKVFFYLSGPPGVIIRNSTRVINATPNELLNPKFNVITNETPGTILLSLYVSTAGANATYSLPVVVVKGTGSSLSSQSPGNQAQLFLNVYKYGSIVGVVTAVAIIGYVVNSQRNKAKYSKQRADRLVMMRERIKREMEGEGKGNKNTEGNVEGDNEEGA